jgi:PST family polysaccharide transporter
MFDTNPWRSELNKRLEHLRGTGVRGLAENFMSLTAVQVATYLLPLITVPYLVRVLGVEKFGLVAFAQATIQLFIILVDFGFNLSATREIAKNRNDVAALSRIVSGVFLIKSVLLMLGFIVLFVCVTWVDRFAQNPAVYYVSYGMVFGGALFPIWFFQGMERMKYSAAMMLLARTIFAALIFVVVKESSDYLLVPALHALGMFVAGVFSLVMMWRSFHIRFVMPRRTEFVLQVQQSFSFFLATLSSSAMASYNTLMLGLATTNEVVAIYAAAEKLFIAMRGLFYPVMNTLYPFMVVKQNISLYKKIVSVCMLGAIVASGVVYVYSDMVVDLIFGVAFADAGGLVRLFVVVLPVTTMTLLLGYPLLAALGHEKFANGAVVAGSLIHMLLILMLLPDITGRNVVLVFWVSQTVILAIQVYGVYTHRLWSYRRG